MAPESTVSPLPLWGSDPPGLPSTTPGTLMCKELTLGLGVGGRPSRAWGCGEGGGEAAEGQPRAVAATRGGGAFPHWILGFFPPRLRVTLRSDGARSVGGGESDGVVERRLWRRRSALRWRRLVVVVVVWRPGGGTAPEARPGRWRPTEEGGREGRQRNAASPEGPPCPRRARREGLWARPPSADAGPRRPREGADKGRPRRQRRRLGNACRKQISVPTGAGAPRRSPSAPSAGASGSVFLGVCGADDVARACVFPFEAPRLGLLRRPPPARCPPVCVIGGVQWTPHPMLGEVPVPPRVFCASPSGNSWSNVKEQPV